MIQGMSMKSVNSVNNGPIEPIYPAKKKKSLSCNETLENDGAYFLFFYNSGLGDIEIYNNLNRLEDMRHLDDDWNGYNAKNIPQTVIDNGIKFIENIDKQPVVYPTGRKSINMEYDLEDRSYLEFEIFEDTVTCMKVPKRIYDQATFEAFSFMDMDKFNKIVEEFYEEHNRQK